MCLSLRRPFSMRNKTSTYDNDIGVNINFMILLIHQKCSETQILAQKSMAKKKKGLMLLID